MKNEKTKSKKQQSVTSSGPQSFLSSLLQGIPTIGQSIIFLGLFTAPASALKLTLISTSPDPIIPTLGAAEISAYDPFAKNLFVTNASTNQLDVLNISDPNAPIFQNPISFNDIRDLNGDPLGRLNSVAFKSFKNDPLKNGILALAFENVVPEKQGSVLLFNSNGTLLNKSFVGYGPDMVTFSPDGRFVLTANEGEPNFDYSVDPEGSVSIINISDSDPNNWSVTNAGFTAFNNATLDPSVRIFGPGASVAQDLEPEYITVSADSKRAWVTLQENNAIGVLNLEQGIFEQILGLGYKDHSLDGNGLDASDRDGGINIRTYSNLFGIYEPDNIGSYTYQGETYLVTANEGDSRVYPMEDIPNGPDEGDAFNEEDRVEDLILDPTAFPDADVLQQEQNLGRLEVTNTLGDADGDGVYEQLYAFGGRSFSIRNSQGQLIFDSGDAFEQITAELLPQYFNANNEENDSFDNRSDNKGPEPEGLVIGQIGGRTYAFIGLERIGGVMTYDITNPNNPFFVDYVNPLNQLGERISLGPEGLLFISAEDSPNGKPLLVVTNEVSGSTDIYAAVPEPSTILGTLTAIGFLFGNKRKKK